MKLLLIYLILFLLLLLRASASEKGIKQAEYTAGEYAVKEAIVSHDTDIRSLDMHRSFLVMTALFPSNQLDLSSGNENAWNNLTYKILHRISGKNAIARMRMWYSAEWMKMLSTLHVKGFFVYFLRELII